MKNISRIKRGLVAASMLATATTAVAGSSIGALTFAAPQASAASTGWVYISMPTWMGNCAQGSVKWMRISTPQGAFGDFGDDIAYAKVNLSASNSIQGQGQCYVRGRLVSMSVPFSVAITPTRNDQTWWVGPAGATSN